MTMQKSGQEPRSARALSPPHRGALRKLDRVVTAARSRQHARIAALLMGLLPASLLLAQAPVPEPYRPPAIALVQPSGGTPLPRDKPIVVFRFARGEPTDPVDVSTFAVAVDALDRTGNFQVTADEAWGALFTAAAGDSVTHAGTHAVTARICSVRGACAEVTTTVATVASTASATPSSTPTTPPRSTRARLIELVLDAVRKLIVP
jgi:hypothetical protein